MKARLLVLALASLTSFSLPVLAKETDNHSQHLAETNAIATMPSTMDHMAHDMEMPDINPKNEWQKELLASMTPMHNEMMKGFYFDNADDAFVVGMIPHHQGAIEMARIVLKYGKDQKIKDLANDIIAAQEKEISLMLEYLKERKIDVAKLEPKMQQQAWTREYSISMARMHDLMMRAFDYEDADIGFVIGMIPHHQGAVEMAQFELNYGKNEQIKKLAQEIISAQQKEISFMYDYLVEKKVRMPR